MINENTDFFSYVDNFAKINDIESIRVYGNENPLVEFTIAIPTYKRAKYLKEAIDSALNQDCSFAYNVIVVDNNPERNDDTEDLMNLYKGKRNLCYYKNTDNLGMGGNWNRLFQLAKSKWVIMLHDDDMLYTHYLSTCSCLLSKLEDVGILKPKEDRINAYKHVSKKRTKKIRSLDFYYGNSFGTPSGMLFNREMVIEIGGFNQDFYPSLDYCFNVLFSFTHNIYYYDEPLTFYRIEVNESMKIETQRQWLIIDSYLIRQLLKKYDFPNWVIRNFVSRRTVNCHIGLQNRWKNTFDFNIEDVGLKRVSTTEGLFAHFIIKMYKIFNHITLS